MHSMKMNMSIKETLYFCTNIKTFTVTFSAHCKILLFIKQETSILFEYLKIHSVRKKKGWEMKAEKETEEDRRIINCWMSDESAYLLDQSDLRIALPSLKCHSTPSHCSSNSQPDLCRFISDETKIHQIVHMHVQICVKQEKKSGALSEEAISTGSI